MRGKHRKFSLQSQSPFLSSVPLAHAQGVPPYSNTTTVILPEIMINPNGE
jgi:hypothetical protein